MGVICINFIKNKNLSIGILTITVLVIAGFGILYLNNQSQYSGDIANITLAVFDGSESLLVYFTEELGYFKENGLNITFKEYPSGVQCADVLLDGMADISTSSDFVLVSNSFVHKDLRVLSTIATSNTIELIVRKDSGINQLSDLVGKKVGLQRQSSAEFYFGLIASFNGFSIDEVEIIDLSPPENVEAISRGDIDAAVVWEPFVYTMINILGENAVIWPQQNVQDYNFILLTRENWVKNNPDVAKRFLKSLIQTEDHIILNNEESIKFHSDYFGFENDYTNQLWPKMKFVVTLSQAMLILFDDQARWRIENNLTTASEVPNYLDYVYINALEEVKPEAVTIIRGN